MKLIITFLIVLAFIFGSPQAVLSQNAEQLYQKGLMKEEGEGNLQEAINIYNSVVENQSADKTLQAKALLHVGLCYEKMGKEEATKAYQKLVNNFPGQKNEVAIARERLTQLILAADKLIQKENSQPLSKKMTLQKVWSGGTTIMWGSPSPNGKFMTYSDPVSLNLALHELSNGETKMLTNDASEDPLQFNMGSVVSADNKHIAYAWFKNNHEIRIIDVDNPQPKILYANKDENVWPCAWSYDGKTIYARSILNKAGKCRILAVDVKSGNIQVLKTFNKIFWLQLSVSPDNKFIAYNFPIENGNTDVHLISTDGKTTSTIVKYPANDQLLGWFPNNNQILFKSDRSGTWDAWAVKVFKGNTAGEPEKVIPEIGQNASPLGFAKNGTFYYSHMSRKFNGAVLRFDQKREELKSESVNPLLGSIRDAKWSPDGKSIALIKELWIQNKRPFYILNLETGKEQKMVDWLNISKMFWLKDNETILIRGFDQRRGLDKNYSGALYTINTKTGEVSELLSYSEYRGKEWEIELKIAQLIAEGNNNQKNIYYLKNGQLISRELATGMDKTLLKDNNFNSINYSLELSPDAKSLLFCNENQLFIIPLTDPKLIPIVKYITINSITVENNAVWSPEGNYILYSHNIDDGSILWKVSPKGENPKEVWKSKFPICSFSFHPDGEEIVITTLNQETEVWKAENLLTDEMQAEYKEPEGIKIRQIWQAPYLDDLGTVSLDGKYRSYVDWGYGNLAIHNLKTDEKKILTDEANLGESWQYAGSTVISKDGKRIAYSWAKPYNTNELRLANVENPEPELLYKKTGEELYPSAWLSDKEIVAFRSIPDTRTMQLVTFNLMDKIIKVKKTFLPGQFGEGLACSPDEKYIAYCFANSADKGNTDIRLLEANGDRDIPLITHPSNDKVLGWVPGRQEFLFISDRSGSWDLWAIKLEDTKPLGSAKRIYADIGEVSPMGFTRDGECYFGFSRRNFYSGLAPFNKETGKIDLATVQSFESQNFLTTWSPDGQHLAYIKIEDNSKDNPLKLFVQDVKTGEEFQPDNNTLRVSSYRWSPDGNSILVVGREINKLQEKDYKGGIFMVDIKTSQIDQILLLSEYEFNRPEDDSAPLSCVEWSQDKRNVYYLFQKDRLVNHNLETGEDKIIYKFSDFSPYVLETSPDGRNLLFGLEQTGDEKSRLCIIPAEGGKEKTICTSQEAKSIVWAKYSPDGREIYFVELPEFNRSVLWRVPAEGGKPEKIWSPGKRVEIYDIHPDGNQVAYSVRERTTEVRVIENLAQELGKIYSQNE